ncbi:hypothetical protein [Pseudonocardia charpentierae]|uniref:Uncharacterized protein n=1 Tax=Pseudonocardia charpentierae TaxID=3075545 RepID=A0ABU2N7I4_9PSEU|nr:hypothetical protein [Pseudonocardia sp. DSM 45834]MDT0349512.1 hypothetical protein [Pseudonocardia sp. DSM 45834]
MDNGRRCGQLGARCGKRQADAAAAGALLVDEDEDEDDDEDVEPESAFFVDESEVEELFASPDPLEAEESADTFSLAEPSLPGPAASTEAARLSVR